MLRPGGTATIIGMIPFGTKIELHGADFLRDRKIQGTSMGGNRFRVDMPRLLELWRQGKLKLDHMISGHIKLDEINEGFAKMKTGAPVRQLIDFVAPGEGTLIRRWRTAFGFLLLFLLWEVGVHVFAVHEYILPPPSQVLRALTKNWQPVLASAGTTSLEIVAGYALAIVVSIPLAIGIVFSRAMEETVYPVVVFLQIVPKIAVAPLFIIWFGFGFTPKLLLVFLLSFFPIVIAAIAGFRAHRSGDHGLRAHHRRRRIACLRQGPLALRAAGDLHRPEGRRGDFRHCRRGCRIRRVGSRPGLSAAAIQRRSQHADGVRHRHGAGCHRPGGVFRGGIAGTTRHSLARVAE